MNTLKDRCRGISLGIFAGDAGNLRGEAEAARTWGCEILHFDVMDGVFVPQFTGGPGFVKTLAGGMFLDVHLMVQRPAEQVEGFVAAGADIVTVHAEAEQPADAIRCVRQAAESHGRAVLAGVSILPGTSIEDASDLIDMADMVLVAALDPRTNSPANVSEACDRVRELRQRLGDRCPLIEFDGGVTLETIGEIAAASPELVVSGSAVMRADDRKAAFGEMQRAL